MRSANGGLPAHRYTPQVTPRWPRGSEPASQGTHGKDTEQDVPQSGRGGETGVLRKLYSDFNTVCLFCLSCCLLLV